MKKKIRKVIAAVLICVLSVCPAIPAGAQAEQSGKLYDTLDLIQDGAIVGILPETSSNSIKICSYTENEVKQRIFDGLYDMDDSIDLSDFGMKFTDFKVILQNVVNSCPELFYVNSGYAWTPTDSTQVYIDSYQPIYGYTGTQVQSMRTELEAAEDAALSGVDDSWSDKEKALYIHDYLVSQFAYDMSLTKYNVYDLMVNGTAVCQGYTLAYIMLMKDLGISCEPVPSDTMHHIWNEVKIDGNWYHVDLTYDDPTNSQSTIKEYPGFARHNYFLLSDTAIGVTDSSGNGHSGWSEPYACTDTTYDSSDYFWKDSTSPFVNVGGEWYYMNNSSSGGIYTWNPTTDETSEIVDLASDRWKAGTYSYYNDKYTCIAAHDGILYYNTPTAIKQFDVTDPSNISVLDDITVSSYIFGLRIRDYTLEYSVGTAPNSITTMYTALTFDKPDPTATPTPTVTPTPAVTDIPDASSSPTTMTGPNVTEDPNATAAPNVTEDPNATTDPNVTADPNATTDPNVTTAPNVTADPNATADSNATAAPNVTAAPNATTLPVATSTPNSKVSSESSSVTVTTTVTSSSSSSSSSSQVTNDDQNLDEGQDMEDDQSSAIKVLTLYSSIKLTAKKGQKKIVVVTPKKAKVTVALNKKIIKNKKKKVKKITITASANKTGKVNIKLCSKLEKKMKVTVTVLYGGKTVKKSKKI